MTTFGIARSRNEADIIEWSILRMLDQVDHVIIGDDSTDGGQHSLERLVAEGLPLTVVWDDEPAYHQPEVVKRLMLQARDMGAVWAVPFDLDEAWSADVGRVADRLAELPEHVLIATARNMNHTATILDDPIDPDPMHRMGWRSREMLPLMKVAVRIRGDVEMAHGNHSARFLQEPLPPAINGVLESRHFPYRTPEQFIKRVRDNWPDLKASGLSRGHGAHIWAYGEHLDQYGEDGLRAWFNDGMLHKDPEGDDSLVFDPIRSLLEPDEPVGDVKAWP